MKTYLILFLSLYSFSSLCAQTVIGSNASSELEKIKEYVNTKDYSALYMESSMFFQDIFGFSHFEDILKSEEIKILNIIPLYTQEYGGLKSIITKFIFEKNGKNIHKTCVIYFDKDGTDWKFNNLPFRQIELFQMCSYPDAFKEGFYNSKKK